MAKFVADFANMEGGGGGRTRLPEGDYPVKVSKAEVKESRAGNTMIEWTLTITDGKYKNKSLIDRTTLTPKALWRLRDLLQAMGVSVPSKKVSLDTKKYVGRELAVTVVDDEPYNGKISSKVADYLDLETFRGQDVDDDEDDDDEDDEDDGSTDEEEIEDLDLDEI